ncbi:hypothetical protein HID58_003643 [Brassica napus]|uniref:Uncharacterized protein n=1 Tax=Brassica napus TaxID=3708 RepID=A0ABQ8EQZ9_BRANA|nr:hypothetical protein HID58_003643 [Brassica napus]
MLRRQRPGGGRHPPPLTPTVSNFKPRAQWNNSGSSIILYVNLPGPLISSLFFYLFLIRPKYLVDNNYVRFYRDQVEIKKDDKTRAIYIQGQRPLSTHTKARFNEVYRVPESLGRKKPSDKEKQVGTSQEKAVTMANKEEPITSKSVVEGKRAVPAAKVKKEEKVKEGEASSSQIGQQKALHKVKEEEARSTPIIGGSLEAKVFAKEEIERKKVGDIGQKKTVQEVKEEGSTRRPTIDGSLEPKVHAKAEKVVERKGDGEIGQKLNGEGKIGLGEKKEQKHDKMVGYKVSEGGIQERVEEKKVEDAGLVKETRDLKGKPEVMEPRRVDSDVKEDLTKGGEDREKMLEKSSESEKDTLLVEEQRKASMDTPATEGRIQEEKGSHKYDTSLVNVGVASLVIMGFGAYVFVPLVKMFY